MASRRPHRQLHVDAQVARRLAIIFLCFVSIALLIVGSVVESTSPYLVFIPALLGAYEISRIRTN